jgi:LemA protein
MVVLIVAVAVGLVVGVAIAYNGLVRGRQHVREGWAAIDVQLKRRASLIPNLVEVVKGYAEYERGVMTRVTEARASVAAAAGPAAAARANADLTGALRQFFAIAEAYPDLKANERYAQLQRDLADTENKIAYARNYYNGAVEIYNVRVESFPGLLIAKAFGFAPAEFFAADDASRATVATDLG